MKRIFLIIFSLSFSIFADVEVDTYVLPIRIHYKNGTNTLAWIEYNPRAFYYRNPENGPEKRPIPGRSVFYLNKLDSGDSLTVSEQRYNMPDSFFCLIPHPISLKDVDLIEDAHSDSLQAVGIWGTRWVSREAGKVILEKKPVFSALIVIEQDAAYNAEHVYCYDTSFTKVMIRKLYKAGGRNNPTLQKAIRENRIIIIEEVTP
jgi:hypothetical protein